MHVWRMNLRRTKSAVISWAGPISTCLYNFLSPPVNSEEPSTSYQDNDSSCMSLFAAALSKIKDAGKYFVFVKLLTLITEDKFPFHNIIFSLFCEFVQRISLTVYGGFQARRSCHKKRNRKRILWSTWNKSEFRCPHKEPLNPFNSRLQFRSFESDLSFLRKKPYTRTSGPGSGLAGHLFFSHKPIHPQYFSLILNTFRFDECFIALKGSHFWFLFEQFAYGPLVHAWTISQLQNNETAILFNFFFKVTCSPTE